MVGLKDGSLLKGQPLYSGFISELYNNGLGPVSAMSLLQSWKLQSDGLGLGLGSDIFWPF